MPIVNGIIEEGKSIGGEVFTFFNVGKHSDGLYYWGDIPFSNLLKERSKHKPVDYPYEDIVNTSGTVFGRYTQLKPEQRKKVNYGHEYVSYENGVEAIHAIAGGTFFKYNRPSSWFRIADLWGYNDNQGNWFEVTSGKQTSLTVSPNSVIELSTNGLIDEIMTYGALSGYSTNNLNFGFLAWDSNFSTTQSQIYFISLTQIGSNTESLSLIKDSLKLDTKNMGSGKTWRLYPCLTTVNFSQYTMNYDRADGTISGSFFPIPFVNTLSITINSAGSGDAELTKYITVDDPMYMLETVDSINMIYRLPMFSITLYNDGNSTYTIHYECEIIGAENELYKDEFPYSGSITINSGSSATIEYNKEQDPSSAYRFQVYETPIIMRFSYRVGNEKGISNEYELIEGGK